MKCLLLKVFVAGALMVAVLAWPATAVTDVVVLTTDVTAQADGSVITAKVEMINNTKDPQTLGWPIPKAANCSVAAKDRTLDPLVKTTVTLTLDAACFEGQPGTSPKNVEVSFDGVPSVTVKPVEEPVFPLVPLLGCLLIAAAVAIAGGIYAATGIFAGVKVLKEPGKDEVAQADAVKRIVKLRWESLGWVDELVWRRQPEWSYEWDSTVRNLEAGFSLKDSWLANLTVLTSVVSIATSTDFLKVAFGVVPRNELAMMTMAGLISGLLVAAANTLVKVIGKSANEVTVKGLVVSSAVLYGAVVFQILSLVVALYRASESDLLHFVVVMVGITAFWLSSWYLMESLENALTKGAPPGNKFPEVPATVLKTWQANEDWEREVVARRIRIYFKDYLCEESRADAAVDDRTWPIWSPWATTSPGDDPTPRASLF